MGGFQHLFDPKTLIVTVPVFLFSLSLHEFMHAWMADRLGDPTARYMGRLTLNPIAHYDPIGTTMGLVFRVFGWAKPVPVNPSVFKWPKRDMMLTALGGPAINLSVALVCAVAFKVLQLDAVRPDTQAGTAASTLVLVERAIAYAVFLNLALGIFNLIPLYPLDGHHIWRGFLSFRAAMAYDRTKQYGQYLLFALILFGRGLLWIPIRIVLGLTFTDRELARLFDCMQELGLFR